jgi:DNA-binding LacI/PurR family transcriptional regulator
MGVTITEIAEHLNLSTATVSRSLGQSSQVHPATRAMVAKAAMELGYQGRSRRQKNRKRDGVAHRMAVVLQGVDYKSSINAVKLLEGMTAEADGAHIALHIGVSPDQSDAAIRIPEVCLAENGCDLTILMGRHHPGMVAELVKYCPVVSATLRYPGVVHDIADTADYWGLYDLTKVVLDRGHHKLAWISETTLNTGLFEGLRRAGFYEACADRGIGPADVQTLGADAFEGPRIREDRLRRLLDAGVTCIVCVTDRVAFEAIALLNRWRVAVPNRVSVVGFDAIQSYAPAPAGPRLTSVDPSWVEIGRAALSLALRRLRQPSAPQMTLTVSPRLISGETLGPAAPG